MKRDAGLTGVAVSGTAPSKSQPTDPPLGARDALLRLQTAEYEALMNRGNYFMSFYVGITGVVVSILVFILAEWLRSRDAALLWIGGAAVQAALHMYGSYVEEHYLLITYVENELRRAVAKNVALLSPESFWRYEVFLARTLVHENWWGERLLPGAAFVAFVGGVFFRRSFIRQDALWIAVNAVLLVVLLVRAEVRLRLRRRFSRRQSE